MKINDWQTFQLYDFVDENVLSSYIDTQSKSIYFFLTGAYSEKEYFGEGYLKLTYKNISISIYISDEPKKGTTKIVDEENYGDINLLDLCEYEIGQDNVIINGFGEAEGIFGWLMLHIENGNIDGQFSEMDQTDDGLIQYWIETESQRYTNSTLKQLEFNHFIKDYFANKNGKTLKDIAWAWKVMTGKQRL